MVTDYSSGFDSIYSFSFVNGKPRRAPVFEIRTRTRLLAYIPAEIRQLGHNKSFLVWWRLLLKMHL